MSDRIAIAVMRMGLNDETADGFADDLAAGMPSKRKNIPKKIKERGREFLDLAELVARELGLFPCPDDSGLMYDVNAYDKQDADLLDETYRLMDRGITQEQITEIDRNIAAYREEHRRSKAAREHAARNP